MAITVYKETHPRAGDLDGWSLPSMLYARAKETPEAAAFRYKKDGVYNTVTWTSLCGRAAKLAAEFERLGLQMGERVGLMANAHPSAVIAEHAIWYAGGTSVGLFPSAAKDEIAHILKEASPRIVVVQGKAHLDLLLAADVALRQVKHIVMMEDTSASRQDTPCYLGIHFIKDLIGIEAAGTLPAPKSLDGTAIACLVYTSGTTGRPKGVMLSHRSLLYGSDSKKVIVPELANCEQRTVISVPFTHVSPKISAITLPLISQLVPYFPESMSTVFQTIVEVEPTYVVQPPRLYERLSHEVLAEVRKGSAFQRFMYRYGMKIAEFVIRRHYSKGQSPRIINALHKLARLVVFRPLLSKFGYGAVRHAYVGSAPTDPKLIFLWHCWGIDLRESYGLTESGGNVTAQQTAFPSPGNLGGVLPREDFEIKLADDNELLFRSPCIFSGYWSDPDATKAALQNGWLKTGDIASLDEEGNVSLVGRKSRAITTSGGKTLSPERIESTLTDSPYISEAIAVGHGRQFVAAIVELEFLAVTAWAAKRGLKFDRYDELVSHADVKQLISHEIVHANASLGKLEAVRKFVITPTPLSSMNGLYTSLQKLRREEVLRQLSQLVDSMYSDSQPDLTIGS